MCKRACKGSVYLVFCLTVHDRDTRVLLKPAGFRHLLLCEAALICVGTVLPVATGMHLHVGENKQVCPGHTRVMHNLVLASTGHVQRVGEEGRRSDGGQLPPPIPTLRISFF